jgi:hypothetical protein
MLGGMHLQVKQTWGEGKDIVPETPPLQKSCWTGTRYQLRSAQRQINSPQLSSFVSKDRRPLLLSGAGRVGARNGDVWILSLGGVRQPPDVSTHRLDGMAGWSGCANIRQTGIGLQYSSSIRQRIQDTICAPACHRISKRIDLHQKE